MLFEPTIQLRGLSIGFEKCATGFSRAKRSAKDQAVGRAFSLPRQPCREFADKTAVFIVKPILHRLPYPAFGGGSGDAAGCLSMWRRFRFAYSSGGGCWVGWGLALDRF
jgi:hypothetical protein